jgi:serine protease Do
MSGERVRYYIQTDANINPGNSGGPLVNLAAEVVGINTLINTGPGGAYGFAIPINQVRMVAQGLVKDGKVRYPYLGVMLGDLAELPAQERGQLQVPASVTGGAVVRQTVPGGAAAAAGLRAGDVITELDGKPVAGAGDVVDYVATRPIGSKVHLGYQRAGKTAATDVVLGELQSEQARKEQREKGAKLGLAMQTMTPELAESMGVDPATKGVAVTEVADGSPAGQAGLHPGDVILEIDRKSVIAADAASEALNTPRTGGHLLRVRDAEGTRFVTLKSG